MHGETLKIFCYYSFCAIPAHNKSK